MALLSESLWKDVPNFENYQAHPEGEIRNKTTNVDVNKKIDISYSSNNKPNQYGLLYLS
jgi:hypothetical protein